GDIYTFARARRSIPQAAADPAAREVLEMRAVGALSPLRWGRLRKWLMVAPLVAGLGTLAAPGAAEEPASPGSTALVGIETTLRSSFALPTLAGPTHELARLRGRVVLVHFFATWCEPCRAEIASLRELQSRLDGQPFAILPISVAETDGAVRRFFAGDPPPFAILLDRDRSVARAWNIDTLPSTVVLDRALRPRFFAEGDIDWARPDVMNRLAELLTEAPG
ncbi:MAG TPA: TlpA disulfide reductase family protein, partial [Xanthobacteraceae bacterium]|nr:TlpA disulfide reductase family protein [Xanthobacteraceae bacterium]